jgi:sugar lactone lactonase YvrE
MLKKFSFIVTAISLFSITTILFFSSYKGNKDAAVLGITDTQNTGYLPASYRNLGIPQDIVTLPDGSMWYVDSQNTRITKISATGQILRTVGKAGDSQGEFACTPISITVDNEENLYVTESCNNDDGRDRVLKFDFNGGYMDEWASADYSADGQFWLPLVIHYDAFSNSILLVDGGHDRIIKYSKAGEYISNIDNPGTNPDQLNDLFGVTTDAQGKIYITGGGVSPRVQVFNSDYSFVRSFTDPDITAIKDIMVLDDGKVVISSQNSYMVMVFTQTGDLIVKFGDQVIFGHPSFLTKDANNNILVSDYTLKSIQKFDASGNLIPSFRFANSGLSNGLLTTPTDVAYDAAGNLHILHFGGGWGVPRVEKYNNVGTWQSTIIAPEVIPTATYRIKIHNEIIYVVGNYGAQKFALDGTALGWIGSYGSGDGQFSETRGIDWDSNENVYISDIACITGNCGGPASRVQKFDSNGNYLAQWSVRATGIAISSNDTIFVGNPVNGQVVVYDTNGNQVNTLPIPNAGYLLFDADDNLYVSGADTVRIYTTDGTLIDTFGSNGGGLDQFAEVDGFDFNTVTGNLTVADSTNHRVQMFGAGVRIENLNSSADVLTAASAASLTMQFYNPAAPGINDINAKLVFGHYTVSDFNVDLTESRDWNQVEVITLPRESKSFVRNLDPAGAPGISATHSLYIIKRVGQVSVHVCPDAAMITEVALDCPNGYDIPEGHASLTTVRIDGVDYWRVSGLTGTGAMSVITTYLPTVSTTSPATNISSFTATVSGNVTSDGGRTITQRGVVFSTSQSTPTLTNSAKVTVAGTSGVYNANISGLSANTKYYARAYATNANGTSYGAVIQFTTSPPSTVVDPPVTPVTPTPTDTVTATDTPTPTATVQVTPTSVPQTAPQCPVFISFTASSRMIQKGEVVTFNWTTNNADSVSTELSPNSLSPSGSFTITPAETFTAVFIANNAQCNAKKNVTITVVETLPWSNSLAIGAGALVIEAAVATQAATFGNIWLAALSFLDRRKKRSWGYVYDSVTKKPVARAVIRLISKENGSIVDTVVSEANGAFRLTPKVGIFTISITHPHYEFPSKIVTTDSDGGYTAIYTGNDIKIDSADASILLSIPLDPIELSESAKEVARLKAIVSSAGNALSVIVMFGGFAYTLYATIVYPVTTNYLVLAAYILLVSAKLVLSLMQPKTQGTVVTEDGEVVAGVEIGLYDADFKNLLYRTFTSEEGTYSFAVLNNDYVLKIMDSKYQLVSKGILVTEIALPMQTKNDSTRLIVEELIVSKD